ncbi:DUF1294 domain-containing protein [Chryseomicrobium sp. FSL W7-1435]|uniref:DUF1294 domain-containing protein n=1 Tax=Chryseomicrobium sp. FSL W7-1435 TaxID=2921704 RepID=UPI00315AB11D
MEFIGLLVIIMSVVALFTMRYDKQQARKGGQRVPENTLWLLALLGGGPGAYAGMQMFRHKTKHTSFRIGFLMLAVLQLFLLVYLYN